MSNNKARIDTLTKLGERLKKEIVDSPGVASEKTSLELVQAIAKEGSNKMTISLLQTTKIGITMSKAVKTFKRHKRTDGAESWSPVLELAESLVKQWKTSADQEAKKKKTKQQEEFNTTTGLPKNTTEYRARLVKYNKDLYKDPPVLPPGKVTVESKTFPHPTRNKATGALTFSAKNDETNRLLKDFHPNRTPQEILRAGAFGGTYFRAIVSGVTNISYNPGQVLKDTVEDEWIVGLDKKTMLTSQQYRPKINKFGVKCGGSLGMWESSGWITDVDPYGWFQWYCRFYQGRRCDDDLRQLSRWLKSAGPKGRFRSQLCNKILAAKTSPDDATISPVIRQTLLHWGLEITDEVLEKHRKRVGA